MSIFVKTDNPHKLIEGINESIQKGVIDTWSVDSEGDYTHTAKQWEYHAWMHPVEEANRLVFAIWGRKDVNLSTVDYAIYHGRFVEMLLSHFDTDCDSIEVSSLASSYDRIIVEPKKSE